MLYLKTYIASKKDLETIEEGIKYVWHKKLDFIFKDKSKINKTAVISYDSKNIYLFQDSRLKKIPLEIKIPEKFHSYWRTGLEPGGIEKYLPNSIREKTKFETPIVIGGLLTPFIELQSRKKLLNNPYVTKENYLATIVHEFAHVYYNQHNLDRLAKQERLNLLTTALELYLHKTASIRQKPLKLYLPNPLNFSEIFAFCTEYTATSIFFPKHLETIDKFDMKWIKTLIKKEKETPLSEKEITISLNEENTAHATATVVGKIILNFYPDNWPHKLLQQHSL